MKEHSIWKYELAVTDVQNISIPIGAKILTVQVQNGLPCLWVLVDPKADKEMRCFEIFGTGTPVLSDMGTSREYISTFQIRQGNLIFHVFENTGL